MSITVNMIASFVDTEGYCAESYPCQHGAFEVVLKDGRKAFANLGANDIYSILKELKDIGQTHKDWNHFSCYSSLQTMGWKILPASEVLTKIFSESAKSRN